MIKKMFCLPKRLVDDMKRIASETGITVSEHVRRALDEYIEKYDLKKKNA